MQEEAKILTQRERLEAELLKVAPDVTANDKQKFMEEHGISNMTVSRYLRGEVMNNDTATTMLRFFKKCISDREKVIKK